MPRINSANELEELRKEIVSKKNPEKPCVAICGGTSCLGFGNQGVIAAFEAAVKKQKLQNKVDVRVTGCHGFCAKGPNIVIFPEEICYVQVRAEDAAEILSETVIGKKVIERLVYTDADGAKKIYRNEVPFYSNQVRNLIGDNTRIDPKKIDDYIGIGGYAALAKALSKMSPVEVLEEIKKASLRGRGGGGFPAGSKWETTRNAKGEVKYVIVNGHEGEPGAYMDRALFQGNPHRILEGLIIGGYAIGAHQGFIYTRHDSPELRANIAEALAKAEEYGFLGKNIMGSGFDFNVEVHLDVGIFVSGESSALMKSIEGKPPEPRPKYIRTSVSGIWDRPSNLNNVETWANVPLIIDKGADWYAGIGSEKSKGTKCISLSGNIVNTGVVEVPFGTPLRAIIYDIGGGIPNGKKLKAAHFGSAMGGSIPEKFLDTPLDFDAFSKLGAAIGAGGLLIMDEDTSMVKMTRFFLNFLTNESCGKCVPCREGIKQMLHILDDMCDGKGKEGDIELLEEICEVTKAASLCSLGRTASDPLRSALRYFRDEFEAKIVKESEKR